MAPPFVVLRCATTVAGCSPEPIGPSHTELGRRADEARAYLTSFGLWSEGADPLVLVQEAPVVGAATVPDLGPWLGAAWTGRRGVLFGTGPGPAHEDDDAVIHELVHVWLRERGVATPRWALHDGVPRHEGALVQEALGDFLAAARRDDPVIARRTTEGGGVPKSLRPFARCPEDLRGDAHDDALVLSGALWEARAAISNETLVRAIGHAAPLANDRVEAFASALEGALGQTSEQAAQRWRDVALRHGLGRCGEPIPMVEGQRLAARVDSFVIPSALELSLAQVSTAVVVGAPPPDAPGLAPAVAALAATGIPAPVAFQIEVPAGQRSVELSLRSNRRERPLPSVRWEARNQDGEAIGRGEVEVDGWPVHQARWTVPAESASLVLRVVLPHTARALRDPGAAASTAVARRESARGLSYDDLRVAFTSDSVVGPVDSGLVAAPVGQVAQVELAPTSPPSSGCAVGGLDSVLTLPLLWALARGRRSRGFGADVSIHNLGTKR